MIRGCFNGQEDPNDKMPFATDGTRFTPQSNQVNDRHNSSVSPGHDAAAAAAAAYTDNPEFEIFEWHPAYQSCQVYFLDHAQHDGTVQALAALVNICLPFQWPSNPVMSYSTQSPPAAGPSYSFNPWSRHGVNSPNQRATPNWVSLVPYIRRLVVTGFDKEPVLHGFFGDDWQKGVGPLQECERRNYLFLAKSGGWSKVKTQYDISPQETVPFLKPLQNVQLAEIESAEKSWSQWLAMEDWMIGPRAPESIDENSTHGTGGASSSRR